MKALIIDDEIDSRRIIRKYLERYFPETRVLAECDSVASGLEALSIYKPDFIFVDIQMGDGTGFDLLDQINFQQIHVIIITAFNQFAVKAFRYHALDYILKPIDPSIFQDAVGKIYKNKSLVLEKESIENLFKNVQKTDRKIGIPTNEGFRFVSVDDVILFEAAGSYCIVHLVKEKVTVSKPMKFFEEKLLQTPAFYRPHKSYIIHLKYVLEYQKLDGGLLKMMNHVLVPISRNKKEETLAILENYFM